ncbi:MAG: LptF/LptG family permease [Thermosynechococcaceae cyanobacterium]
MTVKTPKAKHLNDSSSTPNALNIGIMDLYILKALIMPFLFGVGAFLSISLTLGSLFDLLRQVSDQGLALTVALQILALQIPSFLVLALPMATLLATLTVYNQLSRRSEIIAIQNCGVSLYRLVLPALYLSLAVTLTTFAFNEFVVPPSNIQASRVLDQALHRERPAFQDKNIFYREFERDQLTRVFYARRFDGHWMQDLTILHFLQGSLEDITVTEAAQWNPERDVWELNNGTNYRLARGSSTYQTVSNFKQQNLQLSRAPLDLATEIRRPEQMGVFATQHLLKLVNRTGDLGRIRKLEVQVQAKYAFPWICVVFGLVGSTLGLQAPRRGSAKGFGLSILIIFGYYTLDFICRSLGEAGILTSITGAWLTTIVGLSAGAVLLWQMNRRY